MTSRTSGGLIKFSVALLPDLLARVAQVAKQRLTNRNSAFNELVRRGLDSRDLEQELLRRRGEGLLAMVEVVRAICQPLTDGELEQELRRRQSANTAANSSAA